MARESPGEGFLDEVSEMSPQVLRKGRIVIRYAPLLTASLLLTILASWSTASPCRDGSHMEGSSGKVSGSLLSTQKDSPERTNRGIRIAGYLQLWWTILEEVENGLQHPLTGEEAADQSSGFSFNRARLRVHIESANLSGRLSVRLEGSPPGLLDAFVLLPLLGRRMQIAAGQMKVPSTYEVAVPSDRLDFLTRGELSRNIVDYSLCTSPSLSSPRFSGAKTYLRDLGVALKGEVIGTEYFFMVGNGLGANRFSGGREKKQEIFTNRFGAYLYAARLSFRTDREETKERETHPMMSFEAGSHVSWNNHPNVVLDDERTVLNIKRFSWSADLHTEIAGLLRLTGMYGEGSVEDDFDNDGKTDYRFRGWELKAIAWVFPGALWLGFRYDVFAEERYENGAEDVLHSYVLGVTYEQHENVRLQLNYKRKILKSEVNPDLDDDAFILAAQFSF